MENTLGESPFGIMSLGKYLTPDYSRQEGWTVNRYDDKKTGRRVNRQNNQTDRTASKQAADREADRRVNRQSNQTDRTASKQAADRQEGKQAE